MTVRISRLNNRMIVVTDDMPGIETVALEIWVGAGARYEPADRNGISHFIEHMMFKGTETRGAQDIANEIEAVGGDFNAHTGYEFTIYDVKLRARDDALGVEILADMLQNSRIDERDLEMERDVILQEVEMYRDDPGSQSYDMLRNAAFGDWPVGRPIVGTAETVRAMTREHIRDEMASRYYPANMALAAAGQVDHDDLCRQAELRFKPRFPDARPPLPIRYIGGKRQEAREISQVHLAIGFQGIGRSDPDYHAAAVMADLLGTGMSSRLFQEVREKRGLAYDIGTIWQPLKETGLFGVHAGTSAGQIAEALEVICLELARMTHTVDEDGLRRVRARHELATLWEMERPEQRVSSIVSQLHSVGRIKTAAELIAEINAIDAAKVHRVARRIFASPPSRALLGDFEVNIDVGSVADMIRSKAVLS
jgi:predicted Zn-dependent peptidase